MLYQQANSTNNTWWAHPMARLA